mgnify:CR=1 FL=1
MFRAAYCVKSRLCTPGNREMFVSRKQEASMNSISGIHIVRVQKKALVTLIVGECECEIEAPHLAYVRMQLNTGSNDCSASK